MATILRRKEREREKKVQTLVCCLWMCTSIEKVKIIVKEILNEHNNKLLRGKRKRKDCNGK